MNRWFALLASLALAGTAHAQQMVVDTPNGQVRTSVWGFEGHGGRYVETEADHRLTVERDPLGRTRIKVMAPEGAMLHVFQHHREVYVDDVPTVFEAQPNQRYRLELVFPNGARWRKHIETRPGAVARLWVLGPADDVIAPPAAVVVNQPYQQHAAYPPPPPPAAAPEPMEHHAFRRLKQAIAAESFAQQKLGVLQTAAASAYFTIHQVGELVDLYTFGENKVQAVRLVRAHVVDPQDAFELSSHFTFAANKDAVQQMFR